jgi:histidinol-phosphate aminotransferase
MRPLVVPDITRIAPYQPGKPLEELERELGSRWPAGGAIKLASNENPLGPSAHAVAAATQALAQAHLYPDGDAFYLRHAIAEHLGVAASTVVVGAGSNELIDLLIQCVVGPDEEVLFPAVSFACYRLSALAHLRAFRESPNRPDFGYDVDALLAAVSPRTKLVFLANPNNPTGAYLDRAGLQRLVKELPEDILLAVDEAYFEYARAADYPDTVTFLGKRERLVALRTFSKIHGLAGLRVGYLVGSSEVAGGIHRVRLPFNVSSIAQAAARAALADTEHVARSRALVEGELPALTAALAARGLSVAPSQANFVLVGIGEGKSGAGLYQALLERGVIVRPMASYGLPHHLRVNVGTAAENRRLLQTLDELL